MSDVGGGSDGRWVMGDCLRCGDASGRMSSEKRGGWRWQSRPW